jgi:outer membrane murein-binding lipoprotein Lpp
MKPRQPGNEATRPQGRPVPPRAAFRLPRVREGLWAEAGTWALLAGTAIAAAAMLAGCAAAGGKTQLAAADAMDRAAQELDLAVGEFSRDLESCDDERRARVIEAYTDRVRADAQNPSALADHRTQFTMALERLDSDGDAARTRAAIAHENLGVVREIAGGLRQQAVAAMKLEAETSAYLSAMLERKGNEALSQKGNEATRQQGNEGALLKSSGTSTEGRR